MKSYAVVLLFIDVACLLFLQAILGRKLVVGEMYEVMMKVASLSLTSDSEHVRLQSRQVSQWLPHDRK